MTATIILLHPARELARVMEEEKPMAAWLTPMILEVRLGPRERTRRPARRLGHVRGGDMSARRFRQDLPNSQTKDKAMSMNNWQPPQIAPTVQHRWNLWAFQNGHKTPGAGLKALVKMLGDAAVEAREKGKVAKIRIEEE